MQICVEETWDEASDFSWELFLGDNLDGMFVIEVVELWELARRGLHHVGKAAEYKMLNIALLGGENNVTSGLDFVLHLLFFNYLLVGMPLAGDGEDSIGASKCLSQGLDIVHVCGDNLQPTIIVLLLGEELLGLGRAWVASARSDNPRFGLEQCPNNATALVPCGSKDDDDSWMA